MGRTINKKKRHVNPVPGITSPTNARDSKIDIKKIKP
jgi:hypothetical protein